MTLIEITNLKKAFNTVQVLKDINLSIEKGSFVTLLGPSGCGKTTLLRTLAGFYKQDAGHLSIGGRMIDVIPPESRHMPMVFQDYALFPHMTVFENIGYGLRMRQLARAEVKRQVEEQLRIFNLEGLGKRFPRQLSGGQQQRVAFARALVMGEEILLLDEPLSNLDAKLRVEVRGELRRIQKQTGLTAIYVTHDQEEALAMSDVVAIMNRGEIVQVGTPREIYNQPANRFVAEFVGSVTLVPVTTRLLGNSRVEVSLLGTSGLLAHTGREGTFAVLRPERLTLCSESESPIQGIITDAVFLGRTIRYTVMVGETCLMVDTTYDNEAFSLGQGVGITLDWGNLWLVGEA